MGIIQHVKEEFQVIKERDPAIKSPMEVSLYPSFRVMLSYRRAHKLYLKGHYSGQGFFPSVRREKQGLKYIRVQRSEKDFSSIMEAVLS